MDESMVKKSAEVAKLLKTLGHPKRLLILCALTDGEKTVTELEEICGAGQSQVSQFVKRMENEGFLQNRKDGNFVYYSIKDNRIAELIAKLAEIYC